MTAHPVPTHYQATIRLPAAIDGVAVEPFVGRLIEHPEDGEVLDQGSGAEDGAVVVRFVADDATDAELHARLLAERAPGCEVKAVEPVG